MKRWPLIIALAMSLAGCGYNNFQRLDEQVKAAWSEVLNQYQRRADLIPNIVATVKGEANFEQDTLTKVIEARAKATSIQATPETLNDPAAFDKFQQAQGELTGALSRLMVVIEQYPNLKANQAFQDLRVQLEGTENRITVARNRYIKTVAEYNVLARSFPTNLTAMVFSYKVKPSFTVAERGADHHAAGGELRQAGLASQPLPMTVAMRPRRLVHAALLWRRSSCACRSRGAGAAAGAGAERARHRPDRHARRRAARGARSQADRLRGARRARRSSSLIVPTTQPEDIANYTQRLGDAWKIGRKDVGDGLLVVVAKNDRRVRIEPAKALEGAVPDLAARQIIDARSRPPFAPATSPAA